MAKGQSRPKMVTIQVRPNRSFGLPFNLDKPNEKNAVPGQICRVPEIFGREVVSLGMADFAPEGAKTGKPKTTEKKEEDSLEDF